MISAASIESQLSRPHPCRVRVTMVDGTETVDARGELVVTETTSEPVWGRIAPDQSATSATSTDTTLTLYLPACAAVTSRCPVTLDCNRMVPAGPGGNPSKWEVVSVLPWGVGWETQIRRVT
jgi:hypothetical protein